ncbi:MAG: DNA polymerase III subunit gamma/tau [Spirochaetaceae bacterium]
MNYEVTATRKRPRTFDELTGQEFVVSTLKNSLESGRIAHAYLFAGPRGVGKTSAARILAMSLNCPEGPNADGCIDYPGSEEIARGTALDVIEIDGASNTSVNDVREIKDEVLFAPNSSRYKIYIIDEVHMLSNSAFNALLKTIEEPPPYVIFIFATTEIHKVPATIRSRCQQFNFRLIPLEEIKRLLGEVCEEIGVQAEDEALFWMAKEATGSLRDAYTLLDQVVSFSEGAITLEKIREKLGLVGFDQINDLATALATGERSRAFAAVDRIITSGVSIEQCIIDLTDYFRALLFYKAGISKEALLGFAPDRFAPEVVNAYSATQAERAVSILLELFRSVRYSLNPRFELEIAVSRLAALKEYLTTEEIVSELRSLKEAARRLPSGGAGNGGAVPGATEPGAPELETAPAWSTEEAPPPTPAYGTPTGHHTFVLEQEKVVEIVVKVRKQKPALGAALEKATGWELDEESLTLVFGDAFSARGVQQERSFVEEIVQEALDEEVSLQVEVRGNEAQGGAQAASDENVEMVKKVFRGEVIGEET